MVVYVDDVFVFYSRFFVISSFDEFLISCKLTCDAVALVICPSNVTAHALESCHRHDGVRDAAVVP